MFLSDEGASQVLSQMGIAVSNDSIRRIYERIKFADEPDIEAIGIDDVALRKGRTYATAIYDLNDHHMIALLEGKLGETVKEWLKSHKKIKLAARDRTNAYGGPISDILPECVQVADRFHLLNNLLKYLKDIFNSQMPQNIFIHDGEVLERAPKKIPTEDIIDTPNLNYDNSVPVDENGREIVFESRMNNPSSTAYKQQVAKRKKTAINYSSPSNGEN